MKQEHTQNDRMARATLSPNATRALLILSGRGRVDSETFRERAALPTPDYEALIFWLQREGLVEVKQGSDGNRVREDLLLTDKGRAFLLSVLEKTCELPELV